MRFAKNLKQENLLKKKGIEVRLLKEQRNSFPNIKSFAFGSSTSTNKSIQSTQEQNTNSITSQPYKKYPQYNSFTCRIQKRDTQTKIKKTRQVTFIDQMPVKSAISQKNITMKSILKNENSTTLTTSPTKKNYQNGSRKQIFSSSFNQNNDNKNKFKYNCYSLYDSIEIENQKNKIYVQNNPETNQHNQFSFKKKEILQSN